MVTQIYVAIINEHENSIIYGFQITEFTHET